MWTTEIKRDAASTDMGMAVGRNPGFTDAIKNGKIFFFDLLSIIFHFLDPTRVHFRRELYVNISKIIRYTHTYLDRNT